MTPIPPDVILLRGAPAVGKSTVATALSETIGRGAIVEVDQLRAAQARTDWHCRVQHEVALAVAAQCAHAFNSEKVSPIILVDTFGRDRLPDMQRRLTGLGLQHKAYSLWSTCEALWRRAQLRGDKPGEFSMSELMNHEIFEIRYSQEEFIDTTNMTVTGVTTMILQGSGWLSPEL